MTAATERAWISNDARQWQTDRERDRRARFDELGDLLEVPRITIEEPQASEEILSTHIFAFRRHPYDATQEPYRYCVKCGQREWAAERFPCREWKWLVEYRNFLREETGNGTTGTK